MRFMKVERPQSRNPELQVCILERSYADDISRLERAAIMEIQNAEPCECGIDVNGETEDFWNCANAAYDEWEGPYCRGQKTRELRQQQSDYSWLPSMLKYYWHSGVDEHGLDFLERVGFVHSYA